MTLRIADLNAAHLAGQTQFASFVKTPSQTTASGIWFDLSMSPGNPVPQYYFAAPLAAMPMARSTDGGLDHGESKPGYTKMLRNVCLQIVTATAAPLALRLLDYLMFYPGVAMDVGTQDLTNVATLPRYTDGRGVQIMVVEQSSYVGNAQFRLTYTNSDGVAGRVTPTMVCNTQVVSGTITTSATATAGCSGPFVPLDHGDAGVRSIQQVEFLTGDVGLLALVLVKPIARLSCYEITSPSETDFLLEYGELPAIKDDAYLNFICKPVGTLASAPIAGDITTVWSTT
ncbi:MAG: hypothetical protein V5B60_18690 [Accumulibacter sp.]|jgi:hypothetical protein|uniref:hypothetical protein n=1 Tax=Accumulibacter sp. TaxID=2053492 RepID=UPI002FC3DB83